MTKSHELHCLDTSTVTFRNNGRAELIEFLDLSERALQEVEKMIDATIPILDVDDISGLLQDDVPRLGSSPRRLSPRLQQHAKPQSSPIRPPPPKESSRCDMIYDVDLEVDHDRNPGENSDKNSVGNTENNSPTAPASSTRLDSLKRKRVTFADDTVPHERALSRKYRLERKGSVITLIPIDDLTPQP